MKARDVHDYDKLEEELKNGADVHRHSELLLRWALVEGDIRSVKILLNYGADLFADNDDAPVPFDIIKNLREIQPHQQVVDTYNFVMCHLRKQKILELE